MVMSCEEEIKIETMKQKNKMEIIEASHHAKMEELAIELKIAAENSKGKSA